MPILTPRFSAYRFVAPLCLALACAAPAVTTQAHDSYANLVDKTLPAVVNISTSQTVSISNSPLGDLFSHQFPKDHPFGGLPELLERFYGDGNEGGGKTQKTASLGSGFVISPEGYIVTNYHVTEKADEITVIFADETQYEATVVGADSKTDMALLKIDAGKSLPYLKWADSDKARVGDHVIAIGNPFGLGGSVSSGIISARARDINSGPFDDYLQTDAAINRGNSGGPLLNKNGRVIGVNTAIFSPSGGNVGIGFAVPAALAEPIVGQLKTYGKTKRGWLGVRIQEVSEEIAGSLGMKDDTGALIIDVMKNSPAEAAGFMSGDVILRFDGKDISKTRSLSRIVAETDAGATVNVDIWRNERKKTMRVNVGELKENAGGAVVPADSGKQEPSGAILGMRVYAITPDIIARFGLTDDQKGVLVFDVSSDSPAFEQGIRKGDIILSVNREDVSSAEDVRAQTDISADAEKPALFMLNRKGDAMFIAVPIK